MSSAVIFGGCGFIGLYYAEELINQKSYDKIYLVDIKEPEDDFGKSKYKNILATGKVNFLKKDIRENLNDLDINESVNIILNFAAVHREPGHLDHEYFDTNLKGAENICSFSNHHKCNNIIFLSSIAVYGAGDHEKNE
jgi:nucleoside-diphosphate-sugar epimerase